MLTKEEKKLLNALKEQMDDEQKEALSEASEEDIKELLKEAKNEMEEIDPNSFSGRMKMIRSMSGGEFVKATGGKEPISAALAWVLLRIFGTKKGCGCLIVIILTAIIAFAIAVVVSE